MLSVIPTPIGNLKDITLRALETLKKCDIVFCEDTRRTLKLLSAYNISKRVLRYNDHIEKTLIQCFSLLEEGRHICLLTDGGMPTVSDPGWKLIRKARENKIPVEVLPGPSAFVTAVAGSGLPCDCFVFLGFLARSEGRIVKSLKSAFSLSKPVVLYESPHRLKKFIEILKNHFPTIKVIIARELTKVFEQWIEGSVLEIYEKIRDMEIKGEITVILYKSKDILENSESQKNKIKKILFVCSGNTCRSVMAHYYFRKMADEKNLRLEVSSAGICVNEKYKVPDIVTKLLGKENIEFSHTPLQINYEMAEKQDLILTMTLQQKEFLIGFLPDFEEKIFLFSEYAGLGDIDISDPYGMAEINYEMTFKTIKNITKNLIEKLLSQ